jgi:leucine-rich PPR motif-containing protein
LEADNFVLTGGMYALLSELYAHHDKLEEVWTTINKLKESEPDFPLDSMKIVKIVALLVKNDRVPGKNIYIVIFYFLPFARVPSASL